MYNMYKMDGELRVLYIKSCKIKRKKKKTNGSKDEAEVIL